MSTAQPSFQPGPHTGTGWAAAPPHVPPPSPGTPALAPTPPRTSLIAVLALVLAALALLGVVVTALWTGLGEGGAGSDDGYGYGPLRGQIALHDGGVGGVDLAAAVRSEVEADGGYVGRMSCPDTGRVGQNVTTVCHGVVDDSDWAMVVFFEDAAGNYTVLPV